MTTTSFKDSVVDFILTTSDSMTSSLMLYPDNVCSSNPTAEKVKLYGPPDGIRENVNTPELSVLVPEVKLVLLFLTTTETPEMGSLLLLETSPFTRLCFSWENT